MNNFFLDNESGGAQVVKNKKKFDSPYICCKCRGFLEGRYVVKREGYYFHLSCYKLHLKRMRAIGVAILKTIEIDLKMIEKYKSHMIAEEL